MVEAPDNCGIALVSFPWGLEMENLADRDLAWRIIIAGEILVCL
jgi:hypothetical protein